GNYFDWPDHIHHINALSHNYFDSLDHYIPSYPGKIYRTLIEVPAFRTQFIKRYRELLQGPFSEARIQQIVENIQNEIAPMMPYHIARWGYPTSINNWHQDVQRIIEFCSQRRPYIIGQLKRLEDRTFPTIIASDKE
ncbi:MAG: CotH kinase family protein, partial [Cyclobacteriaceae bacterium]